MKKILFIIALQTSFAFADEPRLGMVGPPPDEDAIKQLLSKVSSSCSSKDFRGFMNCFTPKRAAAIRKTAEDSFICGSLSMDVLDFFLISSDEESISFGVKYVWSDERLGKVTYCSKVVAKRFGDDWLIDSEQIRNFSSQAAVSATQNVAVQQQKPVCVGGRCALPGGGWRAPNPANGGEEAFLPKDIMYKPGPSCANGNCRR